MSPKPRLLRFAEQFGSEGIIDSQILTSTFELPKTARPIVNLEVIVDDQAKDISSRPKVLCIHDNGELSCYSGDLSAEEWNTFSKSQLGRVDAAQTGKMVLTSLFNLDQAQKSLLKDRDDLSSVSAASHDRSATNLLLLLERLLPSTLTGSKHAVTLRLLMIDVRSGNILNHHHQSVRDSRCQELAYVPVPQPEYLQSKEAFFKLHGSSGTLYQSTAEEVAIYDITALFPRLTHKLKLSTGNSVFSCLRISPCLLAVTSAVSLSLIDTKFFSLQEEYPLGRIPNDSGAIRADQKLADPAKDQGNSRVLSYFDPSSLLVALHGRRLIAVQLAETITQQHTPRKRKRSGLLVDSVGRGTPSASNHAAPLSCPGKLPGILGQYLAADHEGDEWKALKVQLNKFLRENKVDEFDQAFLSLSASKGGFRRGTPSVIWDSQVDYLLNKMFSIVEMPQAKQSDGRGKQKALRINFFPKATWQHLLDRGQLNLDRVLISLKSHRSIQLTEMPNDIALIQAIADEDKSLTILSSFLASSCQIKATEIVHALRIAIIQLQVHAQLGETKLLTDGTSVRINENSQNEEIQLTGMDVNQTLSQFNVKSSPVDKFQSFLDIAMERLGTCPGSTLTESLKTQLSVPELRIFVDLLRMNLAQSGWLSLYTENGSAFSSGTRRGNKRIVTIARLLNCIIDSIGTGGWLLTTSWTDDLAANADIISSMKAEVSAALEGIEEATYLHGVLGEILLCGKNTLSSNGRHVQSTVKTEVSEIRALPLGLKLSQGISLTKIGAGGELQRRSKRDIGRLKNMQVPKYSFERINV